MCWASSGNVFINKGEKKIKSTDEYYTLYEDIEKELQYYRDELLGKTIYCNCDNPKHSNFVKYFRNNFERLELKELIASYRNLDGTGGIAFYDGLNWQYGALKNGSYDSEELTGYLNLADIVVTNPPYSNLSNFINFLLDSNKDFIVMGNATAITIARIFNAFKEQRIFYGHHIDRSCNFVVPMENYRNLKTKEKNGNHHLNIGNITWWTTFPNKNIKPPVVPSVEYDPQNYEKYFNYDAINVNRVKDIPEDYYGEMGVPIGYAYRHNSDLFEIINLSNKVKKTRQDVPNRPDNIWIEKDGKPWKMPYKRIIIKRRKI